MAQPKIAFAITADDKSEKGIKSFEKRAGLIPKHLSANNRAWAKDTQETVSRTSAGMMRTMGRVERATVQAFGGRSITSGITTRFGAVRAAAGEVSQGLAGAAEAGSALEGTMLGLGVVAGATVGVLGAVTYGAFKLADGWAKGAAGIGRMADTMGVARKEMQEFAAAAERMGIDKGVATGGLGSLSQTLNDARYGRNRDALAVLTKMGVGLKLNSDGTVNVAQMLPAIADAIAAQNSSGRRSAAHALGLSDAMVPLLAQGGKALSADMADAGNTAYIANDEDIAIGKRIQRKGAMVGQLKDRALALAGRATADAAEPGYDAVLAGGRSIVGGATSFGGIVRNTFAPAAGMVERGGRAIERAAYALQAAGGGAGRLTAGQVSTKARRGARLVPKLMALGLSRSDAIAFASNAVMESDANPGARERGGHGVGLFQITDQRRKALFKRVMGVSPEAATEDQQLKYQVWEITHSEAGGWRKAHQDGGDSASVAAGYARFVERPANKDRDAAERAAVASAMSSIPVHVTIDMQGVPRGTQATVRAGGRSKPAISHAQHY